MGSRAFLRPGMERATQRAGDEGDKELECMGRNVFVSLSGPQVRERIGAGKQGAEWDLVSMQARI